MNRAELVFVSASRGEPGVALEMPRHNDCASRTDARLRAELKRPVKQISRQIRAIKKSPNFEY